MLFRSQKVVVVINLTILSSGAIDSVEIVRSPGQAYSDEAIRLVKEGPSWTAARKDGITVDEKVRLRIVFK